MEVASRFVLNTKRPARSAPGFNSWEETWPGMLPARATVSGCTQLQQLSASGAPLGGEKEDRDPAWPAVIAGVMYQEGGTEESTTRFELLVLIYTPCPRAMPTPCTRHAHAMHTPEDRGSGHTDTAPSTVLLRGPRSNIEGPTVRPYVRGPRARHLSAACACRSSSLSASPTLSSSRHRCSHSRAAALSLSLAWQSPAKSAAWLGLGLG